MIFKNWNPLPKASQQRKAQDQLASLVNSANPSQTPQKIERIIPIITNTFYEASINYPSAKATKKKKQPPKPKTILEMHR